MSSSRYSSENPSGLVWELLSISLTKENLSTVWNYKFNTGSIEGIRFLFDQAKELFFNSRGLSLSVAPLNQFYSFSLLSKIMVLVGSGKRKIENLDQSHSATANLTNRTKLHNENVLVKLLDSGTIRELFDLFPDTGDIDSIDLQHCLSLMIDAFQHVPSPRVAQIGPISIFDTRPNEPGTEPKDLALDLTIPTHNPKAIEKLISNYPDLPFNLLKPKTYTTSLDSAGIHYRYYFNRNEINPFNHETYINDNHYLVSGLSGRVGRTFLNQIELSYLFSFACSNLV